VRIEVRHLEFQCVVQYDALTEQRAIVHLSFI
jgi:hypothetical protein